MAKRNRLIDAAVAAALFAGIATVGLAQTTPKDAVANRQAAMKAIGAQGAALRGPAATPDQRRAAAKVVYDNLTILGANVPAGSGAEAGVPTKAKAEIWTDNAGFKAALDNALKAADTAAKADDASVQAAATALFGACGGCHTKYRAA
jgi:cytochrome c556